MFSESLTADFARFCISNMGLVVCISIWAHADYRSIKKNWDYDSLRKKWHRQRWCYKAATGIVWASLFAYAEARPIWVMLIYFTTFAFYAIWFWWLVFDLRLNKIRNLSPYYIGTRAGTDSFLEEIQQAFSLTDKQTHLYVKVPGFAFSLALIVLTMLCFNDAL